MLGNLQLIGSKGLNTIEKICVKSLGNNTFYNSSLVIILYGNFKPVLKPCLNTASNRVAKIMKI